MFHRVTRALVACVRVLESIANGATAKGGSGGATGTDGAFSGEMARSHFYSLCACFSEHLIPHVAACTNQLVPMWIPPSELCPTGTRRSEDEEVGRLVGAVDVILRPLHVEVYSTSDADAANAEQESEGATFHEHKE